MPLIEISATDQKDISFLHKADEFVKTSGLVDLQVNGFRGIDFNTPGLSTETFEHALEAMLAGRDYVCGERFTAADIYVGAQVVWGVDFDTLPRRDTFVAYAERVKQRVAYRIADTIDEELIAERGPQD